MKKKILSVSLLCITVVLVLCMFTGCTKLNENMIPTDGNGAFLVTNIDELGNDFILGTSSSVSDTDDVFSFDLSDKKDVSDYVLKVETNTAGYAYIAKRVKLTGGCYYRIDYTAYLSSISEFTSGVPAKGIYVAIMEDEDLDFEKKQTLNDSDISEPVSSSLTFRAKKTDYATIAICFGSEENPAKITAELNAFSVKRVTKSEAEEFFVGDYLSDYYGRVDNFNIFYIVMGSVAILALCIAGYVMLRRHYALSGMDSELNEVRYKNSFLLNLNENNKLNIILFAGIGLFIHLLVNILSTAIASQFNVTKTFIGYNIQGLATQALFIAQHGPQYLLQSYAGDFATDGGYTVMSVSSSPLQLYLLGFAGLLGRIFEKSNPYLATMFFIRFFESIANIGTAYILYILIKKHSGQIGGLIMATMYLCLPVVFASSALWGYMESVTAFLIILTVYFMLENNYIGMAVTYFVAFLFAQSALFLAPFVLFYTILICIKDVSEGEYKNLIAACSILVLSFFVYYALSAPFAINYIQGGKPFYWFSYAWDELYTGALYTINAFNFQAILGNNLVQVSTASLVVTIIFIVFMLALAGIAYFKFKNRMNLVLLATAFINMLFVFGNQMQPISIFISLSLMLLYAIMNKEKRIYFAFVAFAILSFINISYYETMLSFSANLAPQIMGNPAVMYVFAAFEMLFALYYVYIVYDIVVSRKVRRIAPLSMTFIASIKNFFLRIVKKYYKFRIEHSRS